MAGSADDRALGCARPRVSYGHCGRKNKAFKDAALTLKRRIELLLALPLQKLDSLVIQREINQIGKS